MAYQLRQDLDNDNATTSSDISSTINTSSSVSETETSTSDSASDSTTSLPIFTNTTTVSLPSITSSPLSTSTSSTSRLPSITSSTQTEATVSFTPLITSTSSVFVDDATPAPSNIATPSPTANLTTIVTSVGGKATTVTSQLPTSLVTSSPSTTSDSHRTRVVAGTTSAVFAVIILILAGIFAYRKHTLQKARASAGKRREGKGLLDGEDFDDDDVPPHMRQVESLNSQRHSLSRPISPAPSLLKSRVADTGSIFREEIWPPPGFVDPISKNNSQVDLSKIVDDVMGPDLTQHHERDLTDATMTSDLSATMTATSTTPLVHDRRHRSNSSLGYQDPFAASIQAPYRPHHSHFPPGASPPAQPGLVSYNSSTSSISPTHVNTSSETSSSQISESGSTLHQSMSASTSSDLIAPPRPLAGSTLPKKSSPLARALTQDQKLFSGRPPSGS